MEKRFKNKEQFLTLLFTTAFSTSVLFLFGPLQMYITNLTEFWFPIFDVLWPSAITFVLMWTLFTVIGILFARCEKLFYIYVSLIWGLGLALYVQGNFIQLNYGILDGKAIDWSAYGKEALLSGGIWVICLALPFALQVILPKSGATILVYAAKGLLIVQLVAMGITCLTTDFSNTMVADSHLSDKGLYEVSDEQNVIVFILDTFDKSYFDQIYEETPEFVDFLDGFTFFSNATSVYPATQASISYLLTSQYYENDRPYAQYITEAWEKSETYYKSLKKEGFDIGIYTPFENTISDDAKEKWLSNTSGSGLKVSDHAGLEGAMLQLTAMRFFPDAVKRYVWAYNNVFDTLKSADSIDENPFDWTITSFYQGLISNKLTITKGKKYRFIHLDGTHDPSTVLEDLSEVEAGGENNAIDEARACFNLLREYIKQLKELGLYDKTHIIVTADHGYIALPSPNPILFIKRMGDSGQLQFNTMPVSHENLMATVMSELDIESNAQWGESAFKTDKGATRNRRFLQYMPDSPSEIGFLPDMIEYYVLPDSNDAESYILTGKTYTADGVAEIEPYQCSIGEPITFTKTEDHLYFTSRTTAYIDLENKFLWSTGYSSRACFKIGEAGSDLTCRIHLHSWMPTGTQRVRISSQGELLYSGVVTLDMLTINFPVPHRCVHDGLLILDFETPDACSSKSLGLSKADSRIIAIGFKEILFIEQEETENIIFDRENGNAADYFYAGWHAQENQLCWTDESAKLLAVLSEQKDHLITVNYWTHPGANNTSVYYNDDFIGILPHHDSFGPETILLPKNHSSDSDAQILTFVTDGATIPVEYYKNGESTDTRRLGIAVSEIKFAEVSDCFGN